MVSQFLPCSFHMEYRELSVSQDSSLVVQPQPTPNPPPTPRRFAGVAAAGVSRRQRQHAFAPGPQGPESGRGHSTQRGMGGSLDARSFFWGNGSQTWRLAVSCLGVVGGR